MSTLTCAVTSENATIALAGQLQKLLCPGEIILLDGDLGAGKSFLARHILRAAANDENLEVPSPTFSLMQHYHLGMQSFIHADLYRLSDESEADELGLFDDDQSILLIEWPERLPELKKNASFQLALSLVPYAENTRTIRIAGPEKKLKQLAAALESRSDIHIDRS